MEVHHHTHHPKKWKEYFWEFFMLFLAVFCGFLAELQLEHRIESEREKKYIQSLMKDLVKDSTEASKWLIKNEQREKYNDTLLMLFGRDFKKSQNSTSLYAYFLKTTGLPQFDPNTATMTQLKSSGSLRLIHSQEVLDQILLYDQHTVFLQKINLACIANYQEVWTAAYPVLHVNLFYDRRYADYKNKLLFQSDFPPINCSQESIDIFFGSLARQKSYTQQQITLLKKSISEANNLMSLLRSLYNIN
jgi:hypothetical protein